MNGVIQSGGMNADGNMMLDTIFAAMCLAFSLALIAAFVVRGRLRPWFLAGVWLTTAFTISFPHGTTLLALLLMNFFPVVCGYGAGRALAERVPRFRLSTLLALCLLAALWLGANVLPSRLYSDAESAALVPPHDRNLWRTLDRAHWQFNGWPVHFLFRCSDGTVLVRYSPLAVNLALLIVAAGTATFKLESTARTKNTGPSR